MPRFEDSRGGVITVTGPNVDYYDQHPGWRRVTVAKPTAAPKPAEPAPEPAKPAEAPKSQPKKSTNSQREN